MRRISFEIYTPAVSACRAFYTRYFNFVVKLEAEGFVVLEAPGLPGSELMFCLPHSPFVHLVFHPAFNGQGALLQIEVADVEAEYQRIKQEGLPILLPLVREPVNGYHFAIEDPAGLKIDIVQFD